MSDITFRVEFRDPTGDTAAMTDLTQTEATALINRLRAAFIEPTCIMTTTWKRGDDECPYAF